MKIRFPIFLFFPLILVGVVILWLKLNFVSFPVMLLRIDLASLFLIIGCVVSLGMLFYYLMNERVRKSRQETFAAAAKEQRQLLERLDHELKNPIATIKAGLALLSLDIRDHQCESSSAVDTGNPKNGLPFQETISKIDGQVGRITHLIKDLRKLSDIEVRPLEINQVDLNELLEQLVDELKTDPKYSERTITLSLQNAPWRLPKITADEDLIYLALFNLLENALKYSSCEDVVEIRAVENHHFVDIDIADNGIGIPQEEINQIWRELYRAQNARTKSGNGLGLAIVQRIVTRHNGEISVRSREGEGTSFTMRLPQKH